MHPHIYNQLNKYKRKRKLFLFTEEHKFYVANRHLLTNNLSYFNSSDNESFDVMRNNIVLQGILTKQIIDKVVKDYQESLLEGEKMNNNQLRSLIEDTLVDRPFLIENNERIYLPFFSRALNQIYLKEPNKLLSYPYAQLFDKFDDSFVDPFDTYGCSIFDSSFSQLEFLEYTKEGAAYYYSPTYSLVLVNSQGRLDAWIYLFDKFLHHPDFHNVKDRLHLVIDAFYNGNRGDLLEKLHANGFVSQTFVNLFKIKESI